MAPPLENQKRVLLDTNVWRYVIDKGSQGALLRVAREGPYRVQIAPAVVYETLRLKDAQLRANLVRLMSNWRFHRMMPEAYSDSMEILQEIKRLRPQWLREVPEMQFFNRLKKDWARRTGGFWVRCARSPATEANYLGAVESEMIEGAKTQTLVARQEISASEWKRNPPMDKTVAAFHRPVPGWNGKPLEAWRWDSLTSMTFGLARQGNPYRDWIAPFVELDDGLLLGSQFGSAAWVEFWLHLTDKQAMPRQWMRWAHSFAQRFRKVTPGSPGDTQLFTYFIDTDVVITADKALLDILEECRPYSPCRLPEGRLIPAGATGVVKLLAMLNG